MESNHYRGFREIQQNSGMYIFLKSSDICDTMTMQFSELFEIEIC